MSILQHRTFLSSVLGKEMQPSPKLEWEEVTVSYNCKP